jgi:hypothetical protein
MCSHNVGELWPSLVEKAYAKVGDGYQYAPALCHVMPINGPHTICTPWSQIHGSYSAIEGGSVADCLTDLTGGVTTKIKLDPRSADWSSAAQLWQQLQDWLAEGAVVACKAKPTVTSRVDDLGIEEQEESPMGYGGILLNHGEDSAAAIGLLI